MISLTLEEAQLFNLLASFFGRENVIPHMSVLTVCGEGAEALVSSNRELLAWAKRNKCLFTIIDSRDEPKLVVEFFSGFGDSIDLIEEQHQRLMPPLLKSAGIRYVTFSPEEFSEVLNPSSGVDFVTLMQAKIDQDQV